MGEQPGTVAAAAHGAGFPEPDLRKGADRRRRDDRDSRAEGRGGGSPVRLMPPDRLPARLPSIVGGFSLAYDAALRTPAVVCCFLLRARATKGSRVRGAFHCWKCIGDGPGFRVVTLQRWLSDVQLMAYDTDALAPSLDGMQPVLYQSKLMSSLSSSFFPICLRSRLWGLSCRGDAGQSLLESSALTGN